MMAATDKPKRVIDRERQWRKQDAGFYTSPKGRFEAVRDATGWMLVDTTGENEIEFFGRWRDARHHVEAIEFAVPPADTVELVEDEIIDEFHNVYRVKLVAGGRRIAEVVVRRGAEVETYIDGALTLDQAESFATALMLATHRAAQLDRKETP